MSFCLLALPLGISVQDQLGHSQCCTYINNTWKSILNPRLGYCRGRSLQKGIMDQTKSKLKRSPPLKEHNWNSLCARAVCALGSITFLTAPEPPLQVHSLPLELTQALLHLFQLPHNLCHWNVMRFGLQCRREMLKKAFLTLTIIVGESNGQQYLHIFMSYLLMLS